MAIETRHLTPAEIPTLNPKMPLATEGAQQAARVVSEPRVAPPPADLSELSAARESLPGVPVVDKGTFMRAYASLTSMSRMEAQLELLLALLIDAFARNHRQARIETLKTSELAMQTRLAAAEEIVNKAVTQIVTGVTSGVVQVAAGAVTMGVAAKGFSDLKNASSNSNTTNIDAPDAPPPTAPTSTSSPAIDGPDVSANVDGPDGLSNADAPDDLASSTGVDIGVDTGGFDGPDAVDGADSAPVDQAAQARDIAQQNMAEAQSIKMESKLSESKAKSGEISRAEMEMNKFRARMLQTEAATQIANGSAGVIRSVGDFMSGIDDAERARLEADAQYTDTLAANTRDYAQEFEQELRTSLQNYLSFIQGKQQLGMDLSKV